MSGPNPVRRCSRGDVKVQRVEFPRRREDVCWLCSIPLTTDALGWRPVLLAAAARFGMGQSGQPCLRTWRSWRPADLRSCSYTRDSGSRCACAALRQAPSASSSNRHIVGLVVALDERHHRTQLVGRPLEDWGDQISEPGVSAAVLGRATGRYSARCSTRRVLHVTARHPCRRARRSRSPGLPWQTFKDLLRQGAETLCQTARGSVHA